MAPLPEEISKALLEKKEFTPSTLRTYTSLLSSLYSKLNGDGGVSFFTKEKDTIIDYIANKMESAQSRKTLLSALVNLTQLDVYRSLMLENIRAVNEHYAKRKLDDKQKEVTKRYTEIRSICETLIDTYQQNKSFYNLMNVLIATLCSGYYEGTPPRRLLDYCEMKWKNFTPDDNYIKGNYFYFNIYKTSRHVKNSTGSTTQKIEIPKELRPLISKIKKENLSDYLLLNIKGEKFSSSSFNKRVTVLFGFGVDRLRSIYLTDHVYSDDLLKKLEDTADKMGNSISSQMNYYVKQG
jgi:site-specific recombinase XerD